MDGCHHRFNGKDEWCLIITAIDDATSNIPYGEFFIGETTHGCLKVLKRIVELKGVPKAIYTDRAGWSGGGKRSDFSQFKRACDQIGIQLIFANTPEGKGRIERTFRTIQDRLIPELRLKKIKSMTAATNYFNNEFLQNYWNKEKTVKPENPMAEYSPLNPFIDLDKILCIQEIRTISNDQTVSWQAKRYRVKGSPIYGSYDAIFRTDFSGKTRVFVRDQEVYIEEIVIDQNAPIDQYFKYHKTIKKDETIEPLPFSLYAEMMPTIRRVRNAVIKHQVYGKPLKIPPLRKN